MSTSAEPAPRASSAAPQRSKTLTLATGQTAHLTYFDVTLLRSTPGKDGVSFGWKVRVCYASPHPGQNPDGTTRVSTNPWWARILDAEGGSNAVWVRIDDFPADAGWQPPFAAGPIRLGGCAEGWIAVKHDNPDLQFTGLRYQPIDFGDKVTWSTS